MAPIPVVPQRFAPPKGSSYVTLVMNLLRLVVGRNARSHICGNTSREYHLKAVVVPKAVRCRPLMVFDQV